MKFLETIKFREDRTFAKDLERAIRDTRVVHLVGVDPDGDLQTIYTQLTDALGEIVPADEDAVSGNRSKTPARWTDVRFDDQKSTYFRHSSTQQPLHTDTAYTSYDNDVNFFFCRVRAEAGGATSFIDGQELYRIMTKYEPELVADLGRHVVIFDKGTTERKEKRIMELKGGEVWLNWNYFRVSKDNSDEVRALCDRFHEFLEQKVVKGGLATGIILAPGECVFFQDNHVLHGRNAFFGPRELIKGALNWWPSDKEVPA